MNHPLIILCGPTGVGKSALAMALAKKLNAEIVSADAGQVYQGFDIGTAKPSPKDRELIPHHVIDLWPPDFRADAVLWQRAADRAIEDIESRGKQVLVVGGGGFYIKALLRGLFEGPDPEPEIRKHLQDEFERSGGEVLHRRLAQVDPEAAGRIHTNDPVRLIRALEVYEQTQIPISVHQKKHNFKKTRYPSIMIGLNRDREDIYRRIDERVLKMMEMGWINEAKALYDNWGGDVPAFQLIGYKEIREYFEDKLREDELIPTIQKASRQYAKRQLTWFKGEKDIHWINASKKTKGILEEIIKWSNT